MLLFEASPQCHHQEPSRVELEVIDLSRVEVVENLSLYLKELELG